MEQTKKFDCSFINGNTYIGLDVNSIIGLVLYLVSYVLFIYILSKFALTYIISILTGVLYTFTFILSIILLREKVSIIQIVGVALIAGRMMSMTLTNK